MAEAAAIALEHAARHGLGDMEPPVELFLRRSVPAVEVDLVEPGALVLGGYGDETVRDPAGGKLDRSFIAGDGQHLGARRLDMAGKAGPRPVRDRFDHYSQFLGHGFPPGVARAATALAGGRKGSVDGEAGGRERFPALDIG